MTPKIASATRHTIEQEMAKDPVFYVKFSKLLEDVIEAYHTGRLETVAALKKLEDISTQVATHTEDDIPDALYGRIWRAAISDVYARRWLSTALAARNP